MHKIQAVWTIKGHSITRTTFLQSERMGQRCDCMIVFLEAFVFLKAKDSSYREKVTMGKQKASSPLVTLCEQEHLLQYGKYIAPTPRITLRKQWSHRSPVTNKSWFISSTEKTIYLAWCWADVSGKTIQRKNSYRDWQTKSQLNAGADSPPSPDLCHSPKHRAVNAVCYLGQCGLLNFRLGSLKKKRNQYMQQLLPSLCPLPQSPCTAELHWSHCKEETN